MDLKCCCNLWLWCKWVFFGDGKIFAKLLEKHKFNVHIKSGKANIVPIKYTRGCYCEREKEQANRLLNQFLIRYSHNITKTWIDTKTAQWIKSYLINGVSHKHFNYIFVNKISYFFSKSGVRVEIWTLFYGPPLTSATSEAR